LSTCMTISNIQYPIANEITYTFLAHYPWIQVNNSRHT
jgi:hypothetical protein